MNAYSYSQEELEQLVRFLVLTDQWPYDGPEFRQYRIRYAYVSPAVIENCYEELLNRVSFV